MLDSRASGLLLGFVILLALVRPAAAFGAGNVASISKVEGQNWRHGDIEDALLTLVMARAWGGKKFDKLMVSRVYFGNWLRDYSQALDVGTVKSVSAEAIRLLLCVLGFLTFGYGSGEFEVTAERLGVYRPEDHIDNPKNYADNLDARQYDRRLRGPVDERVELAVDPATGMKNYIANERANIMTAALHVRRLFGGCIQLGRRYKQGRNKKDLYEALRLMGTGLHCLEDFFAHSNYCELALIELGEREVFSLCGRNTAIRLEGARGPVYPVVTGTFGGVDFLHSVTGEVSDRMTQNEIDELEGTLQQSGNSDTSLLRELLDNIPDGFFGGGKKSEKVDQLQSNAAAAQMENMSVSPREPEEFTRYVKRIFEQVMPAIEFHDEVMMSITEAIEKIPVLPKLVSQLEDQMSIFVFSLIAPFVVPLIDQIKNELQTGSDEIIQSSEKEQHNVFYDENCSDPTHSMLAKDHFSNILNEVAGRTSARMVHWVVPQLMEAIDRDEIDIERTLNRIIYGIMHHPAQRHMGEDGASDGRQLCFESVQTWWQEMDDEQRNDYRRKLSPEGIRNGDNHKEGVYDTGHGHGCSGKLQMRKQYGGPETFEDKIAGAAAGAIMGGATGIVSEIVGKNSGFDLLGSGNGGGSREEGGLGGFLGAASSMLQGALGGTENPVREFSERRGEDGSFTRTETVFGHEGNRYEQAEYSETRFPGGGAQSEYRSYEQQESYGNNGFRNYEYEERQQTRQISRGYEERREEESREEYEPRYERREESYGGGGYGGRGGGYNQEYERQGEGRYERENERGSAEEYSGGYERRDEGGFGGYERRQEGGYNENYEERGNFEERGNYEERRNYEERGNYEEYGRREERNEDEYEEGYEDRRY